MEISKDQFNRDLIIRLQDGDQIAFAIIYDNYSAALFGLISRIVLDPDAAQDVLQDSFVKIWKNASSYSFEKGTFFTWMLNICRNTSIDYLRKVKKEQENKNQMITENVDIEKQSMMNVNTIGLKNIIDKLPEEQRIIIDYLYFRGFTQQELADELNLPLGTVKTRARNAVLDLKTYFVIILVFWTLKNI